MRKATATQEGNKSILATYGCTKHPKITAVAVWGRGNTCADSDQSLINTGGILLDQLQQLRTTQECGQQS